MALLLSFGLLLALASVQHVSSLPTAPRRLLSSAASASQQHVLAQARGAALILPLHRQGASFVATLHLGSGRAKQRFTGVIATASALVQVPCGAEQAAATYRPASSSTYAPVGCTDPLVKALAYDARGASVAALNCTFFMKQDSTRQAAATLTYGGKPHPAMLFRDALAVAAAPAAAFAPLMGCAYGPTTTPPASGVIGLNLQPGSLFSQATASGDVAPELSLCLARTGGVLAIGSVSASPAAALSTRPAWTTPLLSAGGGGSGGPRGGGGGGGFLAVGIAAVTVGQSAPLAAAAATARGASATAFVLDSSREGTQYPSALLAAVKDELIHQLQALPVVLDVQDVVAAEGELRVRATAATGALSPAQLDAAFPTLWFTLADGAGRVPFLPSSYLMPGAGTGEYRVAMSAAPAGGVLGSGWMDRKLIQAVQGGANGGTLTITSVDSCEDVQLTPRLE